MRRFGLALRAAASCAPVFFVAATVHADATLPPWVDPGDVPLPSGAQSVAPKRNPTVVVESPGHPERHRGTTVPEARLPLYGTARGAGCNGRWLEVGPLAWVCSDGAEPSREAPFAPPVHRRTDGLPHAYFTVGRDGAEAFLNLQAINDDQRAESTSPDETLDPGFVVALTEERRAHGEGWGRTAHGRWIALRELVPVHQSPFTGAVVTNGALDFGWVATDKAPVYSQPVPRGKGTYRGRLERVLWREERAAPSGGGLMVRVSPDGVSPEDWMRAKDLVHPTLSAPPPEANGGLWVDVDVASNVLVAYRGAVPVYATLVATGKGAVGTEMATPLGVHRIGVKRTTGDLDDIDADADSETDGERASMDDVPWVQAFDHGVAFVGAFWYGGFGRAHSRGSVEMSPKDAAWLFAFTAPHLPAGWTSVEPSEVEPGTVVRVRDGATVAP